MPIQSYLTGEDLKLRNSWLKNIFFPIVYKEVFTSTRFISAAVLEKKDLFLNIFKELQDGAFTDLDADFEGLAKLDFFKVASDREEEVELYNLSPLQMATFLADICSAKNIYWNDVDNDLTVQEIEYFKKETFLGKALTWANLFETTKDKHITPPVVSVPTVTKQMSPLSPRPATSQATTDVPQVQPISATQTTVVSKGRLDKTNAAGLLSSDKVFVAVNEVYWIKGRFLDANAKTAPRIHVSPLNASVPLKVKYSSGQGFNDCILYFDDKNMAENFKNLCIQKCPDTRVDKNSFSLRNFKADTNGYFMVSTEFGPALVQARKLREALEQQEVSEIQTDNSEDPTLLEAKIAWEKLDALMK